MRTLSACSLLPAAALLALAGCAGNLPNNSRAAVAPGTVAPAGTVVSANPVVPYAATTPMMMSNGTVVNVPVNGTTSVVTTTTTPGAMPGTVTTYAPAAYAPTTYAQTTYAPIQSASVSPFPMLPPRLSSGEILTLLSDNTANGVSGNGQPYYVRFARDGRIRFREGDFNDGGSWRVTNDDRLCSTMTRTNVGIEQCYSLYRDGTNVSYERDGTRVGSFTVLSGDPMHL